MVGRSKGSNTSRTAKLSKASKPAKVTPPRSGAGAGVAARPRRRGAHARRPVPPLRQRFRPRLPSAGRTIAALLFAGLLGGLLLLLNGPWLRVQRIAFAGGQLTSAEQLRTVLEPVRGASLLALDVDAITAELRRLPAVADAGIEPSLLGEVRVTIAEKQPAFVWRTSALQLIGASDGTLMASLPLGSPLAPQLARLPFVDDRRGASWALRSGDHIAAQTMQTALRFVALDPARLGSTTKRLTVRLDDEYGFIVVALQPTWQAAFGFYGLDPKDDEATVGNRIERQIGALRTLFAQRPEGSVGWVDARNPGKVYFRAKG